jgi:hypothetical protein
VTAGRQWRGTAHSDSAFLMTSTLELAVAKVSQLSEAAQEVIGREILEWMEKLEALRADIQIGIDELDAGLGRELDIEEFLAERHREHGGR